MNQTLNSMPAPLLNALKEQKHPVLLLEGTRNVPEAYREHLSRFGGQIARFLPNALFRSGNAPGSDGILHLAVYTFVIPAMTLNPSLRRSNVGSRGNDGAARYSTNMFMTNKSVIPGRTAAI